MDFTLKIDSSMPFEKISTWSALLSEAREAQEKIQNRSGEGSDFLGWIDLPEKMLQSDELAKIEKSARAIQANSEILVAIGIGGSYLGARAVIEALDGPYKNLSILGGDQEGTAVFFAGQHIYGKELADLVRLLGDRSFSLNVISKSGTTTEPGLAFRVLRNFLKEKTGTKYHERIFATTDKQKGALKQLANNENYTSFVIPDDVGGRFSLFTPVGLLPIQVAGIDIKGLLRGAELAQKSLEKLSGGENPAIVYAALRNYFFRQGINTEVLVSYIPTTRLIAQWWKQLFGESEGKGGKGLWPSSVSFTTDLHSLGQYLQDGPRNFFESLLSWEEEETIKVPFDSENLDGLNYLEGKDFSYINGVARKATVDAHLDGGAQVVTISPGKLNAKNLGALLYFFEYSCALSGYMLGVNPFNQPGVEAYKKNMFNLLGKEGF